MLVTVDKNDFVISVTHEQTESPIREIERSDAMPEATQLCKGPWHYRAGKGTELPLSVFGFSRHSSKLNKTCTECLEARYKRKAEPAKTAASMSVPVRHVGNPPLPVPVLDTPGGLQHKWEVTIVREVTVTVYAKDYLDAGIEAGEGEVTNVRRID